MNSSAAITYAFTLEMKKVSSQRSPDILAKEHISFATVNQKELEDGTVNLWSQRMSSEAAIISATALLTEEVRDRTL